MLTLRLTVFFISINEGLVIKIFSVVAVRIAVIDLIYKSDFMFL